jgi:hypothetical protein
MARSKIDLPNLSNATPGGIVDMCAPDTAEFNRLKKLTDYLKVALKARLTEEHRINPLTHMVKGEKYYATVSVSERTGVDMAKVKSLLTDEQWESCLTTSETVTVRFGEL